MPIASTWELIQWHLDPVALQLGPIAVGWYGLMYGVAFGVSYWLVRRRLAHNECHAIRRVDLEDSLTWIVVGTLLGGRFGYVLFYNFAYFAQHPFEILSPIQFDHGIQFTGISGMSFHGGLAGFACGILLFCWRRKLSWREFADLVAPAAPFGYMFGRIGNFLNGELWGRESSAPWAIRFPADPAGDLKRGILPPTRHPSQLYEAFGEGLLLGLILWSIRNHPKAKGRMASLYLIGYGAIRFLIEFTREPDSQLGLVLGPFSMGQILCFAMIAIGAGLYWRTPGNESAAP